MTLRILAIGKKNDTWVADGVNHYQKRLKKPYDIEWVLLPNSALQDDVARQDESGSILSRIDNDNFVILLDERGKSIDSPALARLLDDTFASSRKVTVVIGGAYGVDSNLHQRADFVWSLSPLVFPHQLVRLVLAEQIYRSQQISAGHPYHHI